MRRGVSMQGRHVRARQVVGLAVEAKRGNLMTQYVFIKGHDFGIDAQVAGEELSRIAERDGSLKSQIVVDEARPVDSPLHAGFEWDDFIAAEAHRRDEAAKLIRHVRVIKGEDEDGEAILERPFIRIVPANRPHQASEYFTSTKVLSTPELRQIAIADAIGFVSRARAKLAEFKEMEKQYLALEKVENELVDTQMKLTRAERAREQRQALVAV